MATNITNSLVREKAKNLGKNECAKWLHEIQQTTSSVKPHYMSYVSFITSCQCEHNKRIKSKNRQNGTSKNDTFMCDRYVFPEAFSQLNKPKYREVGCNSSYFMPVLTLLYNSKEKTVIKCIVIHQVSVNCPNEHQILNWKWNCTLYFNFSCEEIFLICFTYTSGSKGGGRTRRPLTAADL